MYGNFALLFLVRSANRSSHRRCYIEKAVLKISQYPQENTCLGSSSEKRLQQMYFPVNIAKFLKQLI